MSDLATILGAPVAWRKASADAHLKLFLDDLQANILKTHGRHHAAHIFLQFSGVVREQITGVLNSLGEVCTSAYEQLRRNKKLPPFLDGGPVRCLFLSSSGYELLGQTIEKPAGNAFNLGMAARQGTLDDPEQGKWDQNWSGARPDALFLIADADSNVVDEEVATITDWLQQVGVTVMSVERGLQQTRNFQPGTPQAVEHFGYVDGRSQPLFLQEDIDSEAKGGWDPVFKPSQFIVKDPNGAHPVSAGSFFVFRKLEQNVRGFNAAEDTLGRKIFGIPDNAPETPEIREKLDRAGAMVVGRFEDGTPLVNSDKGLAADPPNNFDYSGDPDASKCPFHAHIRKVNPRGDIERQTGIQDPATGRTPIMARRGITYGPLRPHNADLSEFADSGNEPEKDVGLLFMAYMADIEGQFEFTQQSWADSGKFAGNLNKTVVRPLTGIDPIIGQSSSKADRDYTWDDGWTPGGVSRKIGFTQFVTMKGGEYFFAPSLTFLRTVR